MSEANLETVRRIFEAWGKGDFSSADWADPEIVFVDAELTGVKYHGLEEVSRRWADWLQTTRGFRSEAVEFFDSGDQVVTFNQFSGTGRGEWAAAR